MHLAPAKHPDGTIDPWTEIWEDDNIIRLSNLKEEYQRKIRKSKTPREVLHWLTKILQVEELASRHSQETSIV